MERGVSVSSNVKAEIASLVDEYLSKLPQLTERFLVGAVQLF